MDNLPKSPSDTYVVYDLQFYHPDHLEIPVKGRSAALDMYQFQKTANPDKSLGLCTVEKYKKLKHDNQRN